MKILILGCGWYGCHLAKVLLSMGIKFDIIDKSNSIFNGSSLKNQNRLHLGFHYPRSEKTRRECKEGYEKFITEYSEFLQDVNNNIYAIANDSKISYDEYISIFKKELYEFELLDITSFNIKNVHSTGILVKEKYINNKNVKLFFENLLKHKLLDYKYFNEHKYDIIFDCTYGQFINYSNFYYELCVGLLYKTNKKENFIVMDGEFFSIYPYDEEHVLLTHVKYTPVIKSSDIEYINVAKIDVDYIRENIESDVEKFLPNFKKDYIYSSFFKSIKTKFTNEEDDRSLNIIKNDKIHSFIGGKITGIFEMEKYVKDMFNADSACTQSA